MLNNRFVENGEGLVLSTDGPLSNAPTPPRMSFYAPVVLGKRQRMTPEGFLVCEGVPIARTGEMLYAAGEVPVDAGNDGLVRVSRDEEHVFRPETIASFEGKPVTDDHPEDDVTPHNWRQLSIGTVTNVRRGDGQESDLLLADLLIQDAAAIDAVKSGKREVSCGYDADYEQIERGHGRQLNIIGNHVALVDEGRCGPRCAIGDKKSIQTNGVTDMATKRTVWDRVRTAFKANDEAAFNEELEAAQKAMDEDGEENTHRLVIEMKPHEGAKPDETTEDDGEEADDPVMTAINGLTASIAAISARLDKIEAGEAAEATQDDGEETTEEETTEEEDKAKTGDAKAVQAEFTDAVARAEILAPGIKLPTFDAKADPKKTRDSICALRRKALDKAMKDDAMRAHLTPFTTGDNADFSKMTCDAVKLIFGGASELAKRANNQADSRATTSDSTYRDAASQITSINKRNSDFWAQSRK